VGESGGGCCIAESEWCGSCVRTVVGGGRKDLPGGDGKGGDEF